MNQPLLRSLSRPLHLCIAALIGFSLLPAASAFGKGGLPVPVLVSPALPSTLDSLTLDLTASCGMQISPPVVVGNTITVQVTQPVPPPPCVPQFTVVQLPLPQLAEGSYTVQEIVNGMASPETLAFQVSPPATSFVLLDGRFAVSVKWSLPGAAGTSASHDAYAVQLSDEAGYFYFFSGGSPEFLVKAVDGRIINGHYWLFIASLTDVASVVTVSDLQSPVPNCFLSGACVTKTYASAAGFNQNFIDINYWADFP